MALDYRVRKKTQAFEMRCYWWLLNISYKDNVTLRRGWSGGAMVLGKLPVPGRPANLVYSRARAYSACSRCGWGLFGHFSLVYHFSFLSSSLWDTARYRLKYCLKGPLSPKQQTNQPTPEEAHRKIQQLLENMTNWSRNGS